VSRDVLGDVVRALCGATLCATAAVAQTTWSYRGSEASVSLAGPQHHQLRGPYATLSGVAAGTYGVHFGADAAGKPRSLELTVADGEHVSLAVDAAAPARADDVAIAADAWRPAGLSEHVALLAGDAERVVARFAPRSDSGVCGVLVRGGSDGCYRGVWDRARQQVRLERVFAGSLLVLGTAELKNDDRAHTLALQADGFRVELFVDDAAVVHAFDGALVHGSPGAVRAAGGPAIPSVQVGPAAQARQAAALIQRSGSASLHAASVASPGHFHVLELRLDRPHPLVPAVPSGLEPFLLQPPAAPVVAIADFRGTFGRRSLGEVPVSGVFESELLWPLLPALRGQAALVRALLVPADGSVLAGVTPSLPVRL
jgi:hypothetical protein